MSVAAAFPFKTISHIARIRLGNDVQQSQLYKLRMKSCPVSQRHDARYKSPKGNTGFFAVTLAKYDQIPIGYMHKSQI